jgi:hypothetical protein
MVIDADDEDAGPTAAVGPSESDEAGLLDLLLLVVAMMRVDMLTIETEEMICD